ncbi:GNAT family N-acetyltransferase [Flavobacterium sp.]|uniref:GNAT family N-acetyltransferase n=1 Tax=Flavobacterium sp. TaxID=239 RepID=UPI0026268369|nr:GNAT family N-acetyltransferase [Flavobacterium sp.]MDD3005287.1 GNAT family N-acetyltransferase [Flavobacterium sp.]
MIKIQQEENGSKGRFVLYENDNFAGKMTYTYAGLDKIIIDHTGVEEQYNGRGFGKDLFNKVIAFARSKNLKVIPLCPFAKKMFDRDETLNDLKV